MSYKAVIREPIQKWLPMRKSVVSKCFKISPVYLVFEIIQKNFYSPQTRLVRLT